RESEQPRLQGSAGVRGPERPESLTRCRLTRRLRRRLCVLKQRMSIPAAGPLSLDFFAALVIVSYQGNSPAMPRRCFESQITARVGLIARWAQGNLRNLLRTDTPKQVSARPGWTEKVAQTAQSAIATSSRGMPLPERGPCGAPLPAAPEVG